MLSILDALVKIVGLIKDTPDVIARWRKTTPSIAGLGFGENWRLKGILVFIERMEFRVSIDSGAVAFDLRIVNCTKKQLTLDQVRIEFINVNSYSLLSRATFLPASGSAAARSTGTGRFEYVFGAEGVREIKSGLHVSPNRQSAPSFHVNARVQYHFLSDEKQTRAHGEISRRADSLQVLGPGPDGSL